MGRRATIAGVVVIGALLVAAGSADTPARPTSPKATDALRVDAAAIRKATAAYWTACATADRRLANELKTAANLAHARDDGAEEEACLDAARDADQRWANVNTTRDAAPPTPFRFERHN